MNDHMTAPMTTAHVPVTIPATASPLRRHDADDAENAAGEADPRRAVAGVGVPQGPSADEPEECKRDRDDTKEAGRYAGGQERLGRSANAHQTTPAPTH